MCPYAGRYRRRAVAAPAQEEITVSYSDRIRAKIKEIDLEAQLTGLVDDGEKMVHASVEKAGDLAHDKRDDVAGWLDTASEKVNEKTDAKYADQVAKVRDAVLGGVDRLARKRSGADEAAPHEPVALEPPVVDPEQPDQG